jgi:predicted XRE-type DNA-binding protein
MKIKKSSGNVFADMGFDADRAEDLAVKSDLITVLIRAMRQRGLTQGATAKLCGTDQPTLSKVLHGKLNSVSIDRLTRWLVALGSSVSIKVNKPKRHRGEYKGSLSVHAE